MIRWPLSHSWLSDLRAQAIGALFILALVFYALEWAYLAPRQEYFYQLQQQKAILTKQALTLSKLRAENEQRRSDINAYAILTPPTTSQSLLTILAGPDITLKTLKPMVGKTTLSECQRWQTTLKGTPEALAARLGELLANQSQIELIEMHWQQNALDLNLCIRGSLIISPHPETTLRSPFWMQHQHLPRHRSGPLEHWSLSELKLTGTIQTPAGSRALITTPDGRLLSVKPGTPIGREGGHLTDIGHGQILIHDSDHDTHLRVGGFP